MVVRGLSFAVICHCTLSVWLAPCIAGPVEIREVPVADGIASHPVNRGYCLISDGEYQFIAFYDGDTR